MLTALTAHLMPVPQLACLHVQYWFLVGPEQALMARMLLAAPGCFGSCQLMAAVPDGACQQQLQGKLQSCCGLAIGRCAVT